MEEPGERFCDEKGFLGCRDMQMLRENDQKAVWLSVSAAGLRNSS
jgi:hypothetical protein